MICTHPKPAVQGWTPAAATNAMPFGLGQGHPEHPRFWATQTDDHIHPEPAVQELDARNGNKHQAFEVWPRKRMAIVVRNSPCESWTPATATATQGFGLPIAGQQAQS